MKRKLLNEMKLTLQSKSINESYARYAVSAFIGQLDPTVADLGDIRTAVSEAVTNCVVHAYKEKEGKIYICAKYYDEILTFSESSYEENLKSLGVVDLESPSKINIYASCGIVW